MKANIVSNMMNMIFTTDIIKRMKIEEDLGVVVGVTIDVHGMKCAEVKRFINNIIAVIKSTFRLTIIHGYNHGTAIKEMIFNGLYNERIKSKRGDSYNMGMTYLQIV